MSPDNEVPLIPGTSEFSMEVIGVMIGYPGISASHSFSLTLKYEQEYIVVIAGSLIR